MAVTDPTTPLTTTNTANAGVRRGASGEISVGAINAAGLVTLPTFADGALITAISDSERSLPFQITGYIGPQGVTATNPNGWNNSIVILGFRGWDGVSGGGSTGYNWGLHMEPSWDSGSELNAEFHVDYQDGTYPGVGIRPLGLYLNMLTYRTQISLHADAYSFNSSVDDKSWMSWTRNAGNDGIDCTLFNGTNIRHNSHGAYVLYAKNQAGTGFIGLIKATSVSTTNYVAVGSDTDGSGVPVVMRANTVYPQSADVAYTVNAVSGATGAFFQGFVNSAIRVSIASTGSAEFGTSSSAASVTAWNNFITKGTNGGYVITGRGDNNNKHVLYSAGTAGTFQVFSYALSADVFNINAAGSIIAGRQAALATNATGGFLYIPTCAGTPSGTPTSVTGMVPIVFDTTNLKICVYSGGAWKQTAALT